MATAEDRSLHILFVTNNYTPYRGGVVSSILATRAELERRGHWVTIVTLDFGREYYQEESRVVRIFCPVRFAYKKNRMAVPWRAYRQVQKLIAELKPDIVHAHHPFLLGQSALRAAKQANIPVFFTYHTMYHEYTHYIPLPQFLTRWCVARIVNRYCRGVHAIIAPSLAVKEYIEANGTKTPITVIPTGIQPIFLAGAHAIRTSMGDEPFQLLCVSRFVPEKNVPAVLDVCAQLLNAHPTKQFICTLIGYGYEYESLQSYAYNTLKLSSQQVVFLHKPSQDVIAHYYRTADLFLFPSRTDTQGLVIAEAMASGLPVVALDGPGQRSIVRSGYNGLLIDTVQEMVEAIGTIAHDPVLYRLLSAGAWQTAQEYTPAVAAQKMMVAYRSAIG